MVDESLNPPPSKSTEPMSSSALGRLSRHGLIAALGIVLLGSIVYLLVLAFGGAEFVDVTLPNAGSAVAVHHPRPWLVAAAIAGALCLLGWAQAERGRASLRHAADEARREGEAERERLQRQLQSERDRRRREQAERSGQHEQMVRAWRGEREFNRDLRGQIERMQRAHGVLGRHDDVRKMVLELTMSLVDADKGILLSARETPGDGHEVVCFLGFDNDPRESALAQRFATEVIERDATIRENKDDLATVDKRTAADEEVHNLLAIPIYLTDDFSGVIVCANRDGGFHEFDDEVLLAVGDHAGAVLQNSRLHGDLRSAYLSTIGVLADAIELKDPQLRGHSDAVSQYVLAVADRLDFEPSRRESLIFASLLHDVGKLGISERILLKPAALSAEERAVIQLHPRIGYQLVRRVPALQAIAPAVLHHHERFDGDGYPARLRGQAIPLEARIISIADTFSAITSDRPYSSARTSEEACAELERCAGTQFDPEVVRLFCEEVRRRPPELAVGDLLPPDPELELHRSDDEYKLGARSFGMTDSLTLLYSHRHFHDTARAEAQRADIQQRPFAVIVATLLDLGEINRTRGFGAGDDVLRTVADAVQPLAARHRAIAFRASGRRVALLVPDLDLAGAERLAADLVATLRETSNGSAEPRVAAGAAAWRSGEDGEQVINRALAAAEGAVPVGL